MGIGGFFKKLPGRIWKGAKVGLPIAVMLGVPIPALPVIKGIMTLVEAKGVKNKSDVALEEIMPALQAEGIDLPARKIKLIMELLLDDTTNDLPGEDAEWTFDVEKEARKLTE